MKKHYFGIGFVAVIYFLGAYFYFWALDTNIQVYVEHLVFSVFGIMSAILIREVYIGISEAEGVSWCFVLEMLIKFILGIGFATSIISLQIIAETLGKIGS